MPKRVAYRSETVRLACGNTFIRKMTEEPIFGTLSRADLGKLGCYNFAAARRLERWMERTGQTTPKHLARVGLLGLANEKGIGPATIYVALVLLEQNGVNVQDWVEAAETQADIREAKSRRRQRDGTVEDATATS